MLTQRCYDCYELGLRLTQSHRVIAAAETLDDKAPAAHFLVLLLDILQRTASFTTNRQRWETINDLYDECWRMIISIPSGDDYSGLLAYRKCAELLVSIRTAVQGAVVAERTSLHSAWLELGLEIANGWTEFIYSTPSPARPFQIEPPTIQGRIWHWQSTKIHDLVANLGVTLDAVRPDDEKNLCEIDLPVPEVLQEWCRFEQGLAVLRRLVERPRWDRQREGAYQWIHNKCCANNPRLPLKQILAEYERVCKEKNWPQITTIPGISKAAQEYYEYSKDTNRNIRPPPGRQRGRPKKNK